jgi:hypothetical protein
MKYVLCTAIIISFLLAFISGQQIGISSERNHGKFSVLKFNKTAIVNVEEISTIRSFSSGRIRTYVIVRGYLKNAEEFKMSEIKTNNQQEFANMIQTYFGIEDIQTIKSILPIKCDWLVSEQNGKNRIIYSPENHILFEELKELPL